MLQQTQVATVMDYFNRFIDKFPTVHALASADDSDVFKLWEGLGYYSRARNLIKCARIICDEHAGIFPGTYSELLKLPGIGPYTAGAISSIAFGEPVPAVDGNVFRVLSRVFCISDPIDVPQNRVVFQRVASALVFNRPGDFNQALMELGAIVCTPKRVQCTECPVSEVCCAYGKGLVNQLPVKSPKPAKKVLNVMMIVLIDRAEIMVVQHPNHGLLANLWGFPLLEFSESQNESDMMQALADYVLEDFDIHDEPYKVLPGKEHVFTHLKWKTTLFFYRISEKPKVDFPINEWHTIESLEHKAIGTAFKKQLHIVKEQIKDVCEC
jgi:A/G-specific adenine glycosylase